MSLLLQVLGGALLVAVMIGFRMYSDRRITQQRLACGHFGKAECSGVCHDHESKD